MRPLYLKGRVVPVWLICLLIVPLTISVAYAANSSIDTSGGDNIDHIGGEVITVAEDLGATPGGVDVATSDVTAAGASDTNEVAMGTGSEVANETITTGHYTYDCTVAIDAASPTAGKEYTVELKIDGSPHGTLYIECDPTTPATGDDIDLTWDIGTTLSGGVYVIEILPQ